MSPQAVSSEAWELFKTDAAGQWEPVRVFDRLDDACRCILDVETQLPRRLALQAIVSIIDQDVTTVEFTYEGRSSIYRISNVPWVSSCTLLQVQVRPHPPAGGRALVNGTPSKCAKARECRGRVSANRLRSLAGEIDSQHVIG